MNSDQRVGVFVDVANLQQNGGHRMRYDVLREFACRDGETPVRLNAYVVYDADKARMDPGYRRAQNAFQGSLRDYGFKVIQKTVKWYVDDEGNRIGKANCDLDMAVDALLQSESLDRVLLGSGDGDFIQVVKALQNRGCRVEVMGFDNVSFDLRREADLYMSGYLVPDLLPNPMRNGRSWGELGSRVRGVCYHHSDKGFGFARYMRRIAPGLWRTDTRDPESPYGSAFFHDSRLPAGIDADGLPNRNFILEFELAPPVEGEDTPQAVDVVLVSPRPREVAAVRAEMAMGQEPAREEPAPEARQERAA